MSAALLKLKRAYRKDPGNLDLLAATALAYFEAGDREGALDLLQQALQNQPPTAMLMQLVSDLSLKMDMPDFAAKFLTVAIDLEPGEPSNYVNLASCYMKLGKYDEALELTKSIAEMFASYAPAWNILGVVTRQYLNDYYNAITFFNEALRLDPKNIQALNNLAECYAGHMNSIELYEKVLAIEPDNHQVRLSLAISQLQNGMFEEGWRNYEARLKLSEGLSKNVSYNHKISPWKGQSLKGQTILLMPEQGIGDEILFGSMINAVIEDAAQVYVGCASRLVSVYRRSFPAAKVVSFEDKLAFGERVRSFPDIPKAEFNRIDYAVPIGSLPRFYWGGREDMVRHSTSYLTPNQDQAAAFRARLNTGENDLIFGISWRSGKMTSDRMQGYWDFEMVKKLVVTKGVRFVNLQYGATDEELRELKMVAGPNFTVFEDVDLFNDIEANLAIMYNLDLVVGPPIATQMMAMAIGKFTWILASGVPWWMFGDPPSWGLKPRKNIFDARFSRALKYSFFNKGEWAKWEPHTMEMMWQWVSYLKDHK